MKVIKPDHDRRIEIEGVPNPVCRPVDIDESKTAFKELRTLRIYVFDEGSAFDGHAEDDEVLIILLGGSIELTISGAGSNHGPRVLREVSKAQGFPCAAYLPPQGEYRLVAKSEATVAYARATPVMARPPQFIDGCAADAASGATVLLEESTYANKLRAQVIRLEAKHDDAVYRASSGDSEALLHVSFLAPSTESCVLETRSSSSNLQMWDTAATSSTESSVLRARSGCTVMALIVRVETR